MSKAKLKYLSAYVPEGKPKETPKRGGNGEGGGSGRIADIEAALAALNDLLAKQNRDNLDAMYNLDMGNMSTSMKRLFQSYDDGITRAEAGIEAWANETEAGFRAVAEWQDETTRSLARIEGKADKNGASITSLTEFQNETVESLTQIRQESTAQKASIEQLTQFRTDITEALTQIRQESTAQKASIEQLTQFKTDTTEALTQIRQESTAQKASIEQLTQFRTDITEALTQIRQESTAQKASIEQWAKFSTETSEALTAFKQTVASTYATNLLVAQYKDEESAARAALEQWVENNYASNELVASVRTALGENIASVETKADTNTSNLKALAATVSGNTTSIAGVTATANANGSAIASLQSEVQGKNTNGWLYKSISGVTTQANTNGSAIASLQSEVQGKNTNGWLYKSISGVTTQANTNGSAIASLQSAVFDSSGKSRLAAFIAKVEENYATTTQVAEVVDEDGNINSASITAAVIGDKSFIDLIADYVKIGSLKESGSTEINGNNISLLLDANDDNGYRDLEAESRLNFIYKYDNYKLTFADIYTSVDGSTTDLSSRYALNIDANVFWNNYDSESFASLKLWAAGRASLTSNYGIYLATEKENGYISLDAGDNTRIFANKRYSALSNYVGSSTYSFNTDGIYYGSKKILGSDGSGSGGGTVTAVFG